MILPKTNIELQLQRLRKKEVTEAQILENVQNLLEERFTQENRIDSELRSSKGSSANDFNFELLEAENIYHLEHIKKICIDYRLRFLDSRYFKGEVPKSGVSKIKKLEARHNTELKGFKVMAPSKLFKLEDKDDPLLFAPIGNDYYYLVHKWGNDLHPLRKLLVWPFKNMVNLVFFVLLISYWVTLLVPDGLFSKNSSTAEFWIVFFFMFKCIASVVIFYGFALGKNFNPAIWNSKYFNA